ncbi:MAG: sigma-70 family RNA polymerase sigma factor, partial [Planctomycetota bacterium]
MDRRTLIPDDAELLRRGGGGDRAALEQLVRRRVGVIHAAALRRAVPGVSPADLTQATLLVLLQRLSPASRAAQRDGTLVPWLLTTVRHVAANAAKRQRRRDHHESAARRADVAGGDPTEVLAWRELADVLDGAVLALPRADRQVIALKFFEAEPTPVIAERLGLPQATVRKRVSRAVGRLRDRLAKHNAGLECATLVSLLTAHAAAAAAPAVSLTTTGASATAVTLAQGTLAMLKLKLAAGATAAAVVATTLVVSTSSVVAKQSVRLDPAPPPAAEPVDRRITVSLADFDRHADRVEYFSLRDGRRHEVDATGSRDDLLTRLDALGPGLLIDFEREDGIRFHCRAVKLYGVNDLDALDHDGSADDMLRRWSQHATGESMPGSEPSGGLQELEFGVDQFPGVCMLRSLDGTVGLLTFEEITDGEPTRWTGSLEIIGVSSPVTDHEEREAT